MDYSKQQIIREINRYFEPELVRIPKMYEELQQTIQKVQSGGGSDAAKLIGGAFKLTFGLIGGLTNTLNSASSFGWDRGSANLANMFTKTGDLLNKGSNAAGNSLVKSKIQNLQSEIQRIQNGDVNRGISDDELDEKVMCLVPEDLFEKGLYRLGLDEAEISEVEPIYFEDYFIDEDDESQTQVKGRDGVIRTPSYLASWLFGTPQKLCVYQCNINLLTGSYSESDDYYNWKQVKIGSKTENKKGYFDIRGANFVYKFIYNDSPEIRDSIRGMKSYWSLKNE